MNEASIATSALDALTALHYGTGEDEDHALSPRSESDGRGTPHAITETATEASDLFQEEDAPMKRVEAHVHVSYWLDSRFDEPRRAPRRGWRCELLR